MRRVLISAVLVILTSVGSVSAAQPWPAESTTEATKLTLIDEGLDHTDWSGAAWNPETPSLWLASNSGYFWELVEDETEGFKVATNASETHAK